MAFCQQSRTLAPGKEVGWLKDSPGTFRWLRSVAVPHLQRLGVLEAAAGPWRLSKHNGPSDEYKEWKRKMRRKGRGWSAGQRPKSCWTSWRIDWSWWCLRYHRVIMMSITGQKHVEIGSWIFFVYIHCHSVILHHRYTGEWGVFPSVRGSARIGYHGSHVNVRQLSLRWGVLS